MPHRKRKKKSPSSGLQSKMLGLLPNFIHVFRSTCQARQRKRSNMCRIDHPSQPSPNCWNQLAFRGLTTPLSRLRQPNHNLASSPLRLRLLPRTSPRPSQLQPSTHQLGTRAAFTQSSLPPSGVSTGPPANSCLTSCVRAERYVLALLVPSVRPVLRSSSARRGGRHANVWPPSPTWLYQN